MICETLHDYRDVLAVYRVVVPCRRAGLCGSERFLGDKEHNDKSYSDDENWVWFLLVMYALR